MANEIPRRQLDELQTRWILSGLPILLVEGPTDARCFRQVQREPECPDGLRDLDVYSADAVEAPSALLTQHRVTADGAKGRVIAACLELASRDCAAGFRGLVDKDLDDVLGVDWRSTCVLYTDHGCLETAFWREEVFARLAGGFRCEEAIDRVERISCLFSSITAACRKLSALRLAGILNRNLEARMVRSEKVLQIRDWMLEVDSEMLLGQAVVGRNVAALRAAVASAAERLAASDDVNVINGHDLLWLLCYVLKECTTLSRRSIDTDVVESMFFSIGMMVVRFAACPSVASLAEWASLARPRNN